MRNVAFLSLFTGYDSTPYSVLQFLLAFRSGQAKRHHGLPVIMFAPHNSPIERLKTKMFHLRRYFQRIFHLCMLSKPKNFPSGTIFDAYFMIVQGGSKKSNPFSNQYRGGCDFPIGLKFGTIIEKTSKFIM